MSRIAGRRSSSPRTSGRVAEQGETRNDHEIGRVQVLAVQHMGLDPRIDTIEHSRQCRQQVAVRSSIHGEGETGTRRATANLTVSCCDSSGPSRPSSPRS
jgi:hypothetical protein